ncbi:MAG: rhomboid family intramembrane serine protease [Bacteroidota bacterium]
MVTSIWEDLKREFSHGSILTRLIIINASVFVIINLVKIFMSIGGIRDNYIYFRRFFCISSDLWHDLTHPWVFLTHMFLHDGFWHILWNMLFLYWFGRIVSDLIGDRKILGIYILGGLAGVLAFLFATIVLQYPSGGPFYALGASGAVMAIVVASGTLSPDYSMRLLFIGDVKLKYIVMVLVFLDLIAIADDVNTGGHFAHLGGAFFGWIFITRLRQGHDYSTPVNNFFDRANDFFRNLFAKKSSKKRRRPRVVYRNTKIKNGGKGQAYAVSDEEDLSHQEQLDAILDKIKKTGYDSLSSEEKEFLFNASKKK